jgi:hypothetical protein
VNCILTKKMASNPPAISPEYNQSTINPLVIDYLDNFDQAPRNTQRLSSDSQESDNLIENLPRVGNDKNSSDFYTTNIYPLVIADLLDEEYETQLKRESQLDTTSHSKAEPVTSYSNDLDLIPSLQPTKNNDPSSTKVVSGKSIHASTSNNNLTTRTTGYTTIHDKRNLPPKVLRFKEKRKFRTAASTAGGAVVGAIVLGPVGFVLGGAGGYVIAKKVGKVREHKMFEKCLNEEAASRGSNWYTARDAVLT